MQKDENMQNLCLIGMVVAQSELSTNEKINGYFSLYVEVSLGMIVNPNLIGWTRLVVKRGLSAQLE